MAPPLTITVLEQQVGVLKKLAKKRPHNLFAFLLKHASFLPDFCAAFREILANNGARAHQTTGLTRSLVQLLYTWAVHAIGAVGADATQAAQLEALQPAFELLRGLLLSGVEGVRFATSSALSRLLVSQSWSCT